MAVHRTSADLPDYCSIEGMSKDLAFFRKISELRFQTREEDYVLAHVSVPVSRYEEMKNFELSLSVIFKWTLQNKVYGNKEFRSLNVFLQRLFDAHLEYCFMIW